MGGFSSSNSSGGVGPAGRKTSGSYGTRRDAKRASRRNEASTAIKNYVKSGGATGAVIRAITEANKKAKTKKQANVEVGLGKDSMSNYSVAQGGTRQSDGENNKQGIELAKAASKSNPVTEKTQKAAVENATTGPTSVEMASESEAERLLRIKRKGRRATILNVPDDELTLSKKVLLG